MCHRFFETDVTNFYETNVIRSVIKSPFVAKNDSIFSSYFKNLPFRPNERIYFAFLVNICLCKSI